MSDITTTSTTTEKTIAEELREAAKTLRETATVAVPGPWISLYDGDRIVRLDNNTDRGFTDIVDEPVSHAGNAAWIALANPALAEPLASWLEEYARWAKDSIFVYDEEEDTPVHESDYCDGVIGESCQCFAHPLAVARVLNGGAP